MELIQGKIYFIDFEGVQIVGRFFLEGTTNITFYDYLHYWNGYESFKMNKPYCVKSGIKEIREATKPEKMNLIRFELEHNCI